MNVSLASWLVSHFGVDRKLVRDIMLALAFSLVVIIVEWHLAAMYKYLDIVAWTIRSPRKGLF